MIREWIDGYLWRLRTLFNPGDWPVTGSEEFIAWVKAWVQVMALRQVTEAEADAAAQRLLLTPPNFRREWPAAVLGQVQAIRAEQSAPPDSREAAQLASRSCPHCDGMGLVTVWRPDGDPARADPRTTPTATAHCVCPHGRWIRRRIADQDKALLKRFPDLATVLAGQGSWRLRAIDFAGWDQCAAARWASVTDEERDEWRRLVRERLPVFREPSWVEGLAQAWCHDPSLVAATPPPPGAATPADGSLRRVFERAETATASSPEP